MVLTEKGFLETWIFFTLSDKIKETIKIALSLTLAYMIPMGMGWDQGNIAAMTVMFIAVNSLGLQDSFAKGTIRVIATLIGACIGLVLIAIFPQERFAYLISLSLVLFILSYLYFSYEGDKTVFLLTSIMCMMTSANGVDNAFLYGIDRTFMTVFGITVYTLVGVFLWHEKDDNEKSFTTLFQFTWFDPEHFKATVHIFFIYWFSVAFWIYLNPPGGFLVVILASGIGYLTSFSPVRPTLLIILFSMGFIFSTLMYVFILPNLVYAWELALFLFFYTFIGFYFINPKVTIFFLIGLFLLGIQNTMSYNFDVYLMLLLTIYTFLIILMFFYHFPFSTKAEHLFSILSTRFLKIAQKIERLQTKPKTRTTLFFINFYTAYLMQTATKITFWSQKIDLKYFYLVDIKTIEDFTTACHAYGENKTHL